VASVVGLVATSPRIGRVDSTSAFQNDRTMQLLRLIASANAACGCCLLLVPAAVWTWKNFTLQRCSGVRKTMLSHMPQMPFHNE
jgi:hypothetical protein